MKRIQNFFRLIIVLALVFTFATVTGFMAEKVTIPEELLRVIPAPEDISIARSAYGVVTTSHPFATEAAIEVLEDGGNAFDAAVAAELVLGVVMPNATGLGAGGGILIYDAKEGNTYYLDGAERAAGAAYPAMFLDEEGKEMSTQEIYDRGLAHGVPGMIRNLDVMLKRWGTRYFDDGLCDRAIELAEDGWEIDRELSLRIAQTQDKLGPEARKLYVPNGVPLMPGDLLVNKDLGYSLRLIRRHGSGVFYQGEIGEATANYILGMGGITTFDDFKRYQTIIEHPWRIKYKDYTLVASLHNMLTLRILEGFDIAKLDPRSAEKYHLYSFARRVASAMNKYGGRDLLFCDTPFQGLLNEEYLQQEGRALFDPEKRLADVSPGNPWDYQVGDAYVISGLVPQVGSDPEDEHRTNNFTVVDTEGNVVSKTGTLGVGWYCGHQVPGYGFMLAVEQSYFDRDHTSVPRSTNLAEPNKGETGRGMQATMLLKDGKPVMVAGTPGSTHSVFNVISDILDFNMGVAEAVAEPRVNGTSWEDGISEEVLRELGEMGYKMKEKWSDQGCVQIVYWVDNEWIAAADARRDGWAMGVTIE